MRKIPLSIELPRILKLLTYTLLGLLIFSSAYFFVKMSNTAERGYEFRENEFRQKNLESDNRILKQRVLDAQSLSELKVSDVVKKMEEPPKAIYIKPKGPLTKKRQT